MEKKLVAGAQVAGSGTIETIRRSQAGDSDIRTLSQEDPVNRVNEQNDKHNSGTNRGTHAITVWSIGKSKVTK